MKLKRRKNFPKKKREIKRRVKKKLLECWMCREYYNSLKLNREGKHCFIEGNDVSFESEACDLFKLCHYFYCQERHCYLDVVCCITTRRKKRDRQGNEWMDPHWYSKVFSACKQNCKQGRQMEWGVNKFGMPERDKKPTKKLRRRAPKPKIIKDNSLENWADIILGKNKKLKRRIMR